MANAGKTTNYFSPLFPNPYGSSAAPYNNADVPVAWANSSLPPEQLSRKLAYEWFQSSMLPNGSYANPPFVSGAAGRINPVLMDKGVPRILRGYIRRAAYDDDASKARLYFMFNPETITRDYVSYLDQAALDPFNTVFGSDNLVAPPSFMNFRFELFFDRQDEVSQDMNHPGVFVDYQFFDLVVRNVIPADPNGANNTLPDNGVMMVNPRDITVVFSPQITIQGRPINAQVSFEKFSHRMTPIRMRISLEMRVVYIGPIKPATEIVAEKYINDTKASIAPDDSTLFTFTFNDLVIANGASAGATGFQASASPDVQTALSTQTQFFNTPNTGARNDAYSWAQAHVIEGYTEYNRNQRGAGLDANGNIHYTDCSGLVWNAYEAVGLTSKMGWGGSIGGPASTDSMLNSFKSNNWRAVELIYQWNADSATAARTFFSTQENRDKMQSGDLLYRQSAGGKFGHVVFFDSWAGNRLNVFAASGPGGHPQVGHTTVSLDDLVNTYNYYVRARPFGSDSYSSLAGSPGNIGVTY
jgi:hypothetical protein